MRQEIRVRHYSRRTEDVYAAWIRQFIVFHRKRHPCQLGAPDVSAVPGVEVQAVADALEIHPFMLSRWRKEARDGVLRGRVTVPQPVPVPRVREVKRLQALQHKYAVLQEEHALLKKLIRFTSARKATSSRSSTKREDDSR